MDFKVELPDKIAPEQAEQYIADDNFIVQEKRNGRHRLNIRNQNIVLNYNRDGVEGPMESRFVYTLLNEKFPGSFAIDVEQESAALFILDVLLVGKQDQTIRPYGDRLAEAAKRFADVTPMVQIVPSFYGTEAKRRAIRQFQAERAEGVVFKDLRAIYRQGRAEQHHALKFWKTVDCFVLSLNDGQTTKGRRESCELGLVGADGKIVRIGSASLIGKPRLVPGEVVELKYLYATKEFHVVQPSILRRRDDKLAKDCGIGQLVFNRDMQPVR